MRSALVLSLILACRDPPAVAPPPPKEEPKVDLETKAKALADAFIIADGHIDVPHRLSESKDPIDISTRTAEGDFDFVRAKLGGLDAPFMSIYVPASFQETGGAKKVADDLIDMVEGFAKQWPEKFAVARSPEEVEAAVAAGKIALPMGIENGGAIEADLANVKHFYDRGVRYITLTHSKDNLISDSSYDDRKTNKGLSPFGRKVVEEMNRVGIMIDVSHLSDDSIRQILELSKAPVIASHSACRHFTPDFERNISDDLIRGVAKGGGVVMVNFGSGFLTKEAVVDSKARWAAMRGFMNENKVSPNDPKTKAFLEAYSKEHPTIYASIDDVVAHIEHVISLVGVDHVGFGSDFDGVGDSLPRGLEDVSKYPNLIRKLLEKGHTEEEIEKVCSKNVFRVWRAVEAFAKASSPTPREAPSPR